MLKLIYFFVLEKIKKFLKKFNKLFNRLCFFFLPKGINYFINLLPGFTAGIPFKFNGILLSVNIGALILAKLI